MTPTRWPTSAPGSRKGLAHTASLWAMKWAKPGRFRGSWISSPNRQSEQDHGVGRLGLAVLLVGLKRALRTAATAAWSSKEASRRRDLDRAGLAGLVDQHADLGRVRTRAGGATRRDTPAEASPGYWTAEPGQGARPHGHRRRGRRGWPVPARSPGEVPAGSQWAALQPPWRRARSTSKPAQAGVRPTRERLGERARAARAPGARAWPRRPPC